MSGEQGSVLVVDDEAPQREIISTILTAKGFEVSTAGNAREAIRALEPIPPDILLTDLKMTGKDGLELLAEVKKIAPWVPVVLMTAHGTVETAVRAMKEGAFDYLTKPLARDELLLTIGRALERVKLERQNQALREALETRFSSKNLVAEHGAMRDVLRLVEKVAPMTSTVLLVGETGTGKEVVARAIHLASRRKDAAFVAINCAAIPESLLESELFGHEKGSFTGAAARKIGHFERAQGGTILLDEVGDLPLALQPKLLRVLQEREIQRVGGEAPIPLDVRIIAATHRDLAQSTKEGKFREDLYWRINVFPIQLPPLRDRVTDIPILAERFLRQLARENAVEPKQASSEALAALQRYRFPGNVRELQSVIERAALLADASTIRLEDLPVEVRAPVRLQLSGRMDFEIPEDGFVFEEFEREILHQAMHRSGNVIAKAAKMLGMTYRTLQYRLEKFGLRGTGEES